MNVQKVFAKMIKANANDIDVCVVTDYENSIKLLKYLLAYPTTYICNVDIAEKEWKGYDEAYLLDLCKDGAIYCSPAINKESGKPFKGDGLYYIDTEAIGSYMPDEFVFGDSKIKLV